MAIELALEANEAVQATVNLDYSGKTCGNAEPINLVLTDRAAYWVKKSVA